MKHINLFYCSCDGGDEHCTALIRKGSFRFNPHNYSHFWYTYSRYLRRHTTRRCDCSWASTTVVQYRRFKIFRATVKIPAAQRPKHLLCEHEPFREELSISWCQHPGVGGHIVCPTAGCHEEAFSIEDRCSFVSNIQTISASLANYIRQDGNPYRDIEKLSSCW